MAGGGGSGSSGDPGDFMNDVVCEWRCGCGAHNRRERGACRKCTRPRRPDCSWRKPEWRCGRCGKRNYMHRPDCRGCSSVRAAIVISPPPTPDREPRTPVKQPTPAAKAAASPGKQSRIARLEAQLRALKELDASEQTIAAMVQEIERERRARKGARTLGAQRDSAAARLRRARSKLDAANEEVDRALRKQEDAVEEERAAMDELEDVMKAMAECELGAKDGNGRDAALEVSRALLATLERHSEQQGAPPQDVAEQMGRLTAALKAATDGVRFDLEEALGGAAGSSMSDITGDDIEGEGWQPGGAEVEECGALVVVQHELEEERRDVSPAQARAVLRALGGARHGEAAAKRVSELAAIALTDAQEEGRTRSRSPRATASPARAAASPARQE